MQTAIIELISKIILELAIALISVFTAWLLAKIGKKKELQSVSIALEELSDKTMATIGELQQTVVDGMKAASADGKLTKSEIAQLGTMLVQSVFEKLSTPAIKTLEAAGVDIVANIHGIAEDVIHRINEYSKSA